MKILDCRELQCPRPVLETRKQILAHPDEPVQVRVGNDIAQANVTRLATKEGFSVTATHKGDEIVLDLTPTGKERDTAQTTVTAKAEKVAGDTVIYISSSSMGRGSDDLGEVLMRNFICTLLEASELPATMLFVNSGVKLTCEGSAVLEPLQHLVEAGVTINVCGLCLEFYELKDQIKVGQVSNMLDTVEAMQQAAHIIQP
nr:sulfurtransferase-like selenium metabolism protein YedF [uncultured Desulfuromonas sp.]